MQVIRQDRLADFVGKHADKRIFLQCWLADAKNATWSCTDDVLRDCREAKHAGADSVIFTIGRGTVRVAVKAIFQNSILRIDEIGLSV